MENKIYNPHYFILLWVKIIISASLLIFILTASLWLFLNSFGQLPTSNERKSFLLENLNALEHSIKNENAANRMQAIFPEGACFMNSLYGFAWLNLAKQFPKDEILFSKAIREASWVYEDFDKPYIAGVFSSTQVENGIFWLGQKNLILAQILELLPENERPEKFVQNFHTNSEALTKAFLESPTFHLDSYPLQCWHTDNIPAFLSLFVHDRLYKTDYQKAYEKWKDWTLKNLDPFTKMPASKLDSRTGEHFESARGCGNSWTLAFLPQMDLEFSKQQYEQYKKHFQIERLGFKMFREYPKTVNHLEPDIDSGPIILGAGISATSFGLGTSLVNGDFETAADIHGLAEMFSLRNNFEINGKNASEILLGKFPIGDVILTWAYSNQPQNPSIEQPFGSLILGRITFYLAVIFCFGLVFFLGKFILAQTKEFSKHNENA